MAYKLQIRRGLLSALPIGISGEPLFATDTNDLYISNGTTNQKFQKFIASGTSSQFLKGDGSLDSNTYYLASNPSAFIALSALSATAPLSYNNTTGVFTIAQATGSVNGYLSSTDWTTFNNKQATLSLTTTGTSGAATLVGATLNIPQYADQFVGTVTSVSFTLGGTGTDLNSSVTSSTTTPSITLNVPTASATNRGALSSADWSTFNGKQAALSGTGFVKISGTTISYDNSTYYLASNPNSFIALTALSAGTGISYNNTTGVITNASPDQIVSIASGSGISVTGTYPSFTIASTITQYTDTLARLAISETVTGLDYNNTTGVFSLTSGYVIPTTSSATNWDAAYNDKIVSAAVSGTTTKTLTLTQQDAGTITASWTDDNTDAVTSVFGRTGAVTAQSGDYTTTQVTEGTNLYYTDSRARLALSFVAGSGAYNSSTGAITIPTNNNQIVNGAGYTTNVGTVTSVAATAGTGITISGSPITTSGTLTITNSAPDQVVALTASTGISVSGTYPNFTITNTSPSSGGTVTSVAAITLGTTGTDLSSTVANGTTTPVITLQVPTASATNRGALSSADWTTFNNKQSTITLTTTGTSGAATFSSNTLNIPNYGSALTSYVPYSGATTNVNLGAFYINTNYGYFTHGSTGQDWLTRTNNTTGNYEIVDWSSTVARVSLTASGNLGLGVTPSAWGASTIGLDIGAWSAFAAVGGSSFIGFNSYSTSTSAFAYKNSGVIALGYQQTTAGHYWQTAPSGTAGNAITFTQAMTLTANGRLLLGTTTEGTYLLDVNGTGRFSNNVFIEDNKIFALRTSTSEYSIQFRDLDFRLIGSNDASTQRLFSFGYYTSNDITGTWNSKATINSYTGAATFSSSVTATQGFFNGFATNGTPSSAGTAQNFVEFRNTGGDFYIGQESSVAGNFFTGSSAYASVFYSSTAQEFIIGGTRRLQIASTGAATFSSSVTATQFTSQGGRGTSYGYKLPDWQIYNTTSGNRLAFSDYTTDMMTITSGGNLLVGTTTDSGEKLQVNGTGRFVSSNNTTPLTIAAGSNATFEFKGNSTSGYTSTFNINDTALYIGHNSSGRNLVLQTASVDRLTIASDGAATFSSSVTATGLIINNNGEALRAYGASPNVSFYNSANTVRGGYVNHDGSNMNIVANVGGISFGGAATFSSSVTATQYNLSALNTAPATSSSTGTLGEIRIDANHIYVCTATNTWKRVAIATF